MANQVFFVGSAEFEDAFSDDIYVVLANTYYPKEDGTVWEPSDFAALRKEGKFSEKLQALLRDGKPNIGYNLGRVITRVEDIPKVIIDTLEKAYELANKPRR